MGKRKWEWYKAVNMNLVQTANKEKNCVWFKWLVLCTSKIAVFTWFLPKSFWFYFPDQQISDVKTLIIRLCDGWGEVGVDVG